MLPIKDYNPTRRFALVTAVLIGVNIVIYLLVQRPGSTNQTEFAYRYAAIPCEVVTGEPLTETAVVRTLRQGDTSACPIGQDRSGLDNQFAGAGSDAFFADKQVFMALLYSMFLHGGLLHIGGNMLYLWIFGNNIEDRMGIGGYVAFYLAAGLVATLAHVAVQPSSTVPVVGASGAVAGVMGAYLVLYPRAQIRTVITVFLIFIRDVPAVWLLGFWFVTQFFTNPSAGVAWVAHVAGFVFGALVALLLRPKLSSAARYDFGYGH